MEHRDKQGCVKFAMAMWISNRDSRVHNKSPKVDLYFQHQFINENDTRLIARLVFKHKITHYFVIILSEDQIA